MSPFLNENNSAVSGNTLPQPNELKSKGIIMPFDEFHDIGEITEARRKAVAQSIRTVSPEELKKLGEELFAFPDHPWREKFFQLIADSRATFYHAEAGEGVIFLYDRNQDIGLWCLPKSGMGPLSETARQIIKEAIAHNR